MFGEMTLNRGEIKPSPSAEWRMRSSAAAPKLWRDEAELEKTQNLEYRNKAKQGLVFFLLLRLRPAREARLCVHFMPVVIIVQPMDLAAA